MNKLEQRIARALHEQAEADVPSVDLWPDIRAQLTTTQSRKRSRFALSTTHTRRLAFALVLLLIMSGAAWAMPGFFDAQDDGLRQVAQAGLSQRIEQSQTIDGVTVTLHEAYADEERIAVGLTTNAVAGTRYSINISGDSLSNLVGRNETSLDNEIPPDMYFLLRSYSYRSNQRASEDDSEEGALFTFHPRSIVSSNGRLDLRLSGIYVYPSMEGGNTEKWIGPFVFDFSVPFNTGKTIEINQTQQAAGVTMTLKRINVLPSAMHAVLCFDQPTPGPSWTPSSTLFVDDLKTVDGAPEVLTGADAGCFQHTLEISVANASGWILRVDTLYRGGGETAEKFWTDPEEIVGPWEFHYPQPQPEPERVLKRGQVIGDYGDVQGVNWFMLALDQRDGGLMYKLYCEEALSYRGYRLDLFDQTVAVFDPGPHGPVQHCAAGQVVAAGGPIMPPGPLPLQFDVWFRFREEGLPGDLDDYRRFIWDADGQLYRDNE